MAPKRILLLHEDRLLANLLLDKLENVGFVVDFVHDAAAGVQAATARCPDAVVVDPVLPGADIAKLVAQLRPLGGKQPLPVVVLSNARPFFAEAAREAGAVALPRNDNPMGELVSALQNVLKLEPGSTLSKGTNSTSDDGWLKQSLESAPEVLTDLRRSLHEMSREGGSPKAFEEFYRRIHGFAEQMAVLGQRPLHYLAGQIEALALDLFKLPEQVNASVLRTLGQALDFLSSLLGASVRSLLKDPASAQVLVVDDEEGARKIIMAAMRMANLKSVAADTPSTSLAALGVQGFDLIFLDVGLPEMTGFELCAKIRALPLHEKTPIVFITGMATFQNRVQSSLSGGNDFVGKPFNLSELGLKALIWVFKGQLGQV
jgi:DNA-binding response OmpR family regulator